MNKGILCFAVVASIMQFTFATAADNCTGKEAAFLSGTVTSYPSFKGGYSKKGVELSHTHFSLKGSDGRTYDVAVDNVFAHDYDSTKGNSIPNSFSNQIQVGAQVEMCGELYTSSDVGIHWVHTNCGDDSSGPTGYLKVNGGSSLTGNTEYCYLWGN